MLVVPHCHGECLLPPRHCGLGPEEAFLFRWVEADRGAYFACRNNHAGGVRHCRQNKQHLFFMMNGF